MYTILKVNSCLNTKENLSNYTIFTLQNGCKISVKGRKFMEKTIIPNVIIRNFSAVGVNHDYTRFIFRCPRVLMTIYTHFRKVE